MKSHVVTWLVLLLAFTMAKRGDPIMHRGQDLIDWIEGNIKGTFIVFFYDQDSPAQRISEVRQEVKTTILDKYPDFHYYEIDSTDHDFDSVIEMFELDKLSLKYAPTILVASDGKGYWAHGLGAVSEISYKIPKYSTDLRIQNDKSLSR